MAQCLKTKTPLSQTIKNKKKKKFPVFYLFLVHTGTQLSPFRKVFSSFWTAPFEWLYPSTTTHWLLSPPYHILLQQLKFLQQRTCSNSWSSCASSPRISSSSRTSSPRIWRPIVDTTFNTTIQTKNLILYNIPQTIIVSST